MARAGNVKLLLNSRLVTLTGRSSLEHNDGHAENESSSARLRRSSRSPPRPTPCVRPFSLLLGLDEVVNDGVEEDSTNADGAPDELDGGERFAQDKGYTDNDDDALGSVGDRLCDGSGLLEGHGSDLVVAVEPQARRDQVNPNGGGGLDDLDKLTEAGSFLQQHEWDAQQEAKDGGKGELVPDRANAVLESRSFHEFLVLISTDGGEEVGNASRNEGRPGKVKFLDRGQDDTANDNGEAHPLGRGDFLAVHELREDGGEGRFGGFDDLCKRDSAHPHGKDGRAVGAHEAKRDGQHLDNVVFGDSRFGAGVGGEPEEDGVQSTNAELQTGEHHGETGLATGRVECQLVGDVVIVVAQVPEGKVDEQSNVDRSCFGSASTGGAQGIAALGGGGQGLDMKDGREGSKCETRARKRVSHNGALFC